MPAPKLQRFPDEIDRKPVMLVDVPGEANGHHYNPDDGDLYWLTVLKTALFPWKAGQWFHVAAWAAWPVDEVWLLKDLVYHRKHRARLGPSILKCMVTDMDGLCWTWVNEPATRPEVASTLGRFLENTSL